VTRDRIVALCVLAVGVVLLLTSHNRNLTVVVVVMCVLAVALLIADTYVQARNRRRTWERERALRLVPWTTFSEPTHERGKRRIGVRRVTEDGVVLTRDEANDVIVDEADAIAKLDAQGDAMSRAAEYNEGQVWM
jgi:hypothetical protein